MNTPVHFIWQNAPNAHHSKSPKTQQSQSRSPSLNPLSPASPSTTMSTVANTASTIDTENPEVASTSWFSNFDPAFPTTAVSIFANFALSNMFVYGVTGNARLAYLSSVFTVPVSLFMCLRSANEDFERWKRMRHLREKGMPVKLMPFPYKHDWSDYETRLNASKREKAFTGSGDAN